MPVFLVASPDGQSRTVHLERLPFRVGRHSDNDLVLRDAVISKHHCELGLNGTEVWVRDVGSSNGTYVNGVRTTWNRLGDKDTLDIGPYRLVFRDDAAAGDDDPTFIGPAPTSRSPYRNGAPAPPPPGPSPWAPAAPTGTAGNGAGQFDAAATLMGVPVPPRNPAALNLAAGPVRAGIVGLPGHLAGGPPAPGSRPTYPVAAAPTPPPPSLAMGMGPPIGLRTAPGIPSLGASLGAGSAVPAGGVRSTPYAGRTFTPPPTWGSSNGSGATSYPASAPPPAWLGTEGIGHAGPLVVIEGAPEMPTVLTTPLAPGLPATTRDGAAQARAFLAGQAPSVALIQTGAVPRSHSLWLPAVLVLGLALLAGAAVVVAMVGGPAEVVRLLKPTEVAPASSATARAPVVEPGRDAYTALLERLAHDDLPGARAALLEVPAAASFAADARLRVRDAESRAALRAIQEARLHLGAGEVPAARAAFDRAAALGATGEDLDVVRRRLEDAERVRSEVAAAPPAPQVKAAPGRGEGRKKSSRTARTERRDPKPAARSDRRTTPPARETAREAAPPRGPSPEQAALLDRAESALDERDWAGANRLAAQASKHGKSGRLSDVQQRLESKAGDLFDRAEGARSEGTARGDAKARELYRQVMEVAPAGNGFRYRGRAQKALEDLEAP